MANDLVLYNHPQASVIEKQLDILSPRFAAVLGRIMQPERLIRTILISLDRTPKLFDCDRQTLFNAAMSAACLGLEVDGVTGQAFLLPFKDKAQLVTGYKGYNTLAARGSFSIRGAVVREGDGFEYDLASARIIHRPKLGGQGRIIAAWALAVSHSLPSIASVLSIDDLMAVKAKSPGARKPDSPWNDTRVGFPAMCEKTAKRRLNRSMPLNIASPFHYAARMDEAFEEQGRLSWITPVQEIEGGARQVMVAEPDTVESPIAETLIVDAEAIDASMPDEFDELPATIAQKAVSFVGFLTAAESVQKLDARWTRRESASLKQQVEIASPKAYSYLADNYDQRRVTLQQAEEAQKGE